MSSLNKSDFIYVEGGRNLPNNKFTRNDWMQVGDIRDYRIKNNNTGLYITAYRYDTQEVKDANLYGDFYLDFDDEDFEKVRQDALEVLVYLSSKIFYSIPREHIQIFYSGKKGVHLIIPSVILGVEPDKHLNEYYKLMAEEISRYTTNGTLDLKIYDRRRLFRLPLSKHHKTGLFKIPLTYEQLKSMPIEQIKERAMMPVRAEEIPAPYEIQKAKTLYKGTIEKWKVRFESKFNRHNAEAKPLGFVPHCIDHMITEGPTRGQRNNSAAAIVSFWKREGFSQQETWDKLVEWNMDSLSERELKMVIESIYAGNYQYGCSTLEKLSICSTECKLYKKP